MIIIQEQRMLLNVSSHFQLSLTRRRMETVSLLLLLTSLLLFVDFLLCMVSVDRRRQTGLRKTGRISSGKAFSTSTFAHCLRGSLDRVFIRIAECCVGVVAGTGFLPSAVKGCCC